MYVLFFTMHVFALLTCINGRWIVPWIIGANATSGKFFFNSWIWIMPTHRIISICSTNKEMVRFVYLLKNSDVILAIHLKCSKLIFCEWEQFFVVFIQHWVIQWIVCYNFISRKLCEIPSIRTSSLGIFMKNIWHFSLWFNLDFSNVKG